MLRPSGRLRAVNVNYNYRRARAPVTTATPLASSISQVYPSAENEGMTGFIRSMLLSQRVQRSSKNYAVTLLAAGGTLVWP